MKNLIYLSIAMIGIASCAAPPPPPPPPPPAPPAERVAEAMISATAPPLVEDRGVLMRGGTVMVSENGSLVPLTKELTLRNGDKVLPTGDILHADGTKTKIQEGMMIDQSGTMTDANGNRINK